MISINKSGTAVTTPPEFSESGAKLIKFTRGSEEQDEMF